MIEFIVFRVESVDCICLLMWVLVIVWLVGVVSIVVVSVVRVNFFIMYFCLGIFLIIMICDDIGLVWLVEF